MPQMMPMEWVILVLYTLVTVGLIIIILYFAMCAWKWIFIDSWGKKGGKGDQGGRAGGKKSKKWFW